MAEIKEANKDTTRTGIFAAVGTIVMFIVDRFFPELPGEVKAAILVIVTAALIWVDSYIHNNKSIKANGLVPF